MKKTVLILIVLSAVFLASCGVAQRIVSGVAVQTSPHARYLVGTETAILNSMGVFIRLIGYDGTEFGRLGPGAQVTDVERVWFRTMRVPVVALIYKDENYTELIGVWGKTLQINSMNDLLHEIVFSYTPFGNTVLGPRDLGYAYTSFTSAIPKPGYANEYNVLFVGGSYGEVYLDVETQSRKLLFGEVDRLWYRVEGNYYGSRTVNFSYRIVRNGKLEKPPVRGQFTPTVCGDGPGGDVIILTPNGPIKL